MFVVLIDLRGLRLFDRSLLVYIREVFLLVLGTSSSELLCPA